MSAVTVGCCQLAPVLGDPAANRELAAAAVTDAARQGATVVVLPELMSSGYVFASQQEARAWAELPPAIDTPAGRIGVAVCYDLEFPEWVRLPALDGAQRTRTAGCWPAAAAPKHRRSCSPTATSARQRTSR